MTHIFLKCLINNTYSNNILKLLLLFYETAYVYFWIIVNSILIVKFHIYILNIDYMLYKMCVWVYSTYINNVDDKQNKIIPIHLLLYNY